MPGGAVGPLLVVADAGIDQDRVVRGPHQIALDREQERAAVRVHGLGLQPALVRRPVVRRGLREERRAVERRDDLHRARHGQIADLPACECHGIPLLHDDQKSSIAPVGGIPKLAVTQRAVLAEACFGTGAAPVPWSARRHWAVIWGMAKPGGDAVDIEGRAEEKTLDGVAARLTRKRQPCRGLDAFGDHLDRQAVRELRKRECDDLFRTRVAGLLDQRAIRLDAVDRQAPQVAMAEAPPLPKSSSATACRGLSVRPKVVAAGWRKPQRAVGPAGVRSSSGWVRSGRVGFG